MERQGEGAEDIRRMKTQKGEKMAKPRAVDFETPTAEEGDPGRNGKMEAQTDGKGERSWGCPSRDHPPRPPHAQQIQALRPLVS